MRPDLYRPAAEVLIDAVGDGEHRAPFGRAAKRFKDTGLGLSIEVGRYLVQQQHGRVCISMPRLSMGAKMREM